ncbi:MAG TPA: isoprenylcysteine carboxylmethyltransferase family protein [Chthoniobacterales bacterium]
MQREVGTTGPHDAADVLLFPPLILLLTLLAGLGLGRLIPLRWLVRIGPAWRRGAGGVAAVVGIGIAIAGGRALAVLGTNVNPSRPTLAIARTGIFRRTRNPMYVGGGCAFAGLAVWLALDWVLLLMWPSLLVLHYGVVLREERYLERKFGDEYRRYKASVPRYGRLF